jgi:nitrate reductase delta subunit
LPLDKKMMQEIVQITNSRAPSHALPVSVREETNLTRLFEALADLLEYPCDEWAAQLERCRRLSAADVGLSFAFAEFHRQVEGLGIDELQELYTRSFDLNPVCALEVGYHLFGENYKRGLFLARLNETEAPYALKQEHQLPDYLPVLLRLLARLDDEELRAALTKECLLPAVARMLEALSKQLNPYASLIGMVEVVLNREASLNPEVCPVIVA